MTAYESRMKMEYLQKHPMLNDWSQRRIADLSFIVQKKAYGKNAILIYTTCQKRTIIDKIMSLKK